MAKLLVFVASVPLCFGMMWAARQLGVPRPWDINVVTFIGLVVIIVEQRRALRAKYRKQEP